MEISVKAVAECPIVESLLMATWTRCRLDAFSDSGGPSLFRSKYRIFRFAQARQCSKLLAATILWRE